MEQSGNMLVFVILGVVFAAVGVHLFFWSRRQSRLLKRFANARGFRYQAKDSGELDKRINKAVSLDEPGVSHAFSRIRDIVSTNNARLFRAVELLDLVPGRTAEFPNQARVAIAFEMPCPVSGIFLVSTKLTATRRYPPGADGTEAVEALLKKAAVPSPPCPLSLTFSRGQVIASLEPLVVGAATTEHLEYLVDLAARFGGR